jgi:hypothetical protein
MNVSLAEMLYGLKYLTFSYVCPMARSRETHVPFVAVGEFFAPQYNRFFYLLTRNLFLVQFLCGIFCGANRFHQGDKICF